MPSKFASSPVYSTIVDAIPYSTGSPKYAEIDECIRTPPQKTPSSGYCSISPLKDWKIPYADTKQVASMRQTLNRRRSKSLEDFYSVPFKAENFVNAKSGLGKENHNNIHPVQGMKTKTSGNKESAELLKTPPIPERKYSPIASYSTYSSHQKGIQSPPSKDYGDKPYISPSLRATLLPSSSPDSGSQKRQSPDGVELDHQSLNLFKKAKSTLLSNTDTDNLSLSTPEIEDASPKFSILTGSLNPTTRSRYKLDESWKSSETSSTKCSEPRLSILEIKQLDESPKLSRRKLKRRSSSLSTTPGKRLLFGKASKMSSASPKRVSFAKNVKETEKTITNKQLFIHRGMTPDLLKQKQEKKKFESFLSSHESPPKKSISPPKKSNSPNKVASPDKSSPLIANSPTRQSNPQKYLTDNVTSPSRINSESQGNTCGKSLFISKYNDDKSYSQFSSNGLSGTIKEDRIFPPSTTRQVGRRIIGAPKPSHIINISGNIQTSPKKNTENASDVVSRQKSILVASHVISPNKNSEISHLFSPPKNQASQLTSPQKYKERNNITESLKYKLESPHKNIEFTSSSASLPNINRNSVNTFSHNHQDNVSPQKHLTSPNSDSQLIGLSRQVKQQSASKKLFDSSVVTSKLSIHSLVSKLTEKTATICAKELSESDDCLSSDEALIPSVCNRSGSPDLRPDFLRNTAYSHQQSQEVEKEDGDIEVTILHSSPGNKTKEAVNCTQRSGTLCTAALSVNESDSPLHQTSKASCAPAAIFEKSQHAVSITENREFEVALLDNSQGSKTKEDVDCTQRSSVTSCTETTTVEEYDAHLYHTSMTLSVNPVMGENDNPLPVSHLIVKESSPQSLNDMNDVHSTVKAYTSDSLLSKETCCKAEDAEKPNSAHNELFHKSKYTTSPDCEKQTICQYKVEKSLKKMQSFHLPVNEMAAGHKKMPNEDCLQSKEISHPVKVLYTNTLTDTRDIIYTNTNADIQLLENRTNDNLICEKTTVLAVHHSSNSFLNQKSQHPHEDNHNSTNMSVNKNEVHCDLKRLSSIRASPKIVDNDGWITERRRSSKGKSPRSFRSAYNRYLLKSSSTEENELEIDHSSKENGTYLTPNFAVVDIGETISLQTKENVQNALSQESDNTINNGRPIENIGQTHAVNTDKIFLASPAKTKPPILPKPSQASLLAKRKAAVVNNVPSNMNKAASKRRSSLARRELTLTSGSRKFNENNKLSHRVSTGKDKSNERLSNGNDKSNKRVSSGKYKSSTVKFNEQGKCLESSEQDKSIGRDYVQSTNGTCKDSSKFSSQGWSRSQRAGQATRKRSSNGAGTNSVDRRRSKNKSVVEENKSSTFAEKKKFFSQLNMDVRKPNDRQTVGLNRQVKHNSQKHPLLMSTTNTTNEVKNKRESPHKELLLVVNHHSASP